LDFLHEGSLHHGYRATSQFVSFSPSNKLPDYQISYFHQFREAYSQLSTGVPQIFVDAFMRMQHLLDRIGQEIQGEKPISQLQILLCRL
jgi:ABC-type microcin C transport system permease subunit YejB